MGPGGTGHAGGAVSGWWSVKERVRKFVVGLRSEGAAMHDRTYAVLSTLPSLIDRALDFEHLVVEGGELMFKLGQLGLFLR